ncbi:MAG: GNAT family N-acetyltransferase [Pseudomonadota bacterium]
MTALVVFSGLPGTGKTTLARAAAEALGAAHIRIDTIEDALLRSSLGIGQPEEAGYLAGYGLARDNLTSGRTVIADAVNAVEIARTGWREAAKAAGAKLVPVEILCSDIEAHQERIALRPWDLTALPSPDWQAVADRSWEPWPERVIRIDTAGEATQASADRLIRRLRTEIDLQIRPARPDEFDAVARVWLDSWESIGISNEKDLGYDALCKRLPGEVANGWSLYVGDMKGALTGMLAFNRETGWLDEVFVAPAFQGWGVGGALLDFAKAELPGGIGLSTAALNTHARNWYRREGFVEGETTRLEDFDRDVVTYRWRPA